VQTAIVVFTRDLRVHDNPALAAACARAGQVVPVFVADPRLMSSPSRVRFLADSLAGLRDGLRSRGGDLVVRHGDPVTEVMRLAVGTRAQAVFIAGDVSRYAARRRAGLAAGCADHRARYGRLAAGLPGPADHGLRFKRGSLERHLVLHG